MSGRLKRPTHVSLVNDYLVNCDDLCTAAQLAVATRLSVGAVGACLHHLYHHRAADFVEAPGALWWFATPLQDRRIRTLKEIADGVTRKRKAGVKRPRTGFHRD